jgi:hypothetical protein
MLSMQYIEILFLINFGICAVLLGSGMLLDYLLFRSLKKDHAAYYKSIGKPMIVAPLNLTEDGYIQVLRGGVFGYIMVFRGIPKAFPKDARLRKLARAIRIVFAIFLILLIPLVIIGYLFYKSTS